MSCDMRTVVELLVPKADERSCHATTANLILAVYGSEVAVKTTSLTAAKRELCSVFSWEHVVDLLTRMRNVTKKRICRLSHCNRYVSVVKKGHSILFFFGVTLLTMPYKLHWIDRC